MLPLPCDSFPPWTCLNAPESRADAATAVLVEEALAIQREAGGDLGFFAAYRRLAELNVDAALACALLDRGAWRRWAVP
jgi:hypothetical protein